jgi:hypothetical protein
MTMQPCPFCGGMGSEECEECYGNGYFRCNQCNGSGYSLKTENCLMCDESGKVV